MEDARELLERLADSAALTTDKKVAGLVDVSSELSVVDGELAGSRGMASPCGAPNGKSQVREKSSAVRPAGQCGNQCIVVSG